jgi:hypothetical protein
MIAARPLRLGARFIRAWKQNLQPDQAENSRCASLASRADRDGREREMSS